MDGKGKHLKIWDTWMVNGVVSWFYLLFLWRYHTENSSVKIDGQTICLLFLNFELSVKTGNRLLLPKTHINPEN